LAKSRCWWRFSHFSIFVPYICSKGNSYEELQKKNHFAGFDGDITGLSKPTDAEKSMCTSPRKDVTFIQKIPERLKIQLHAEPRIDIDQWRVPKSWRSPKIVIQSWMTMT
jgi:hypothetical protein